MFGHRSLSPTRPGVVGEDQATAVVPLVRAIERGDDVGDASWSVAADYAVRGESLAALLRDVEAVLGRGARRHKGLLRELAIAWSETVLGELHRVSCADPLTGLSSPQHLVTLLQERRGHLADHQLLVVDLLPTPGTRSDRATAALGDSMGLLEASNVLTATLPGQPTPARLAERRCAALTRRAGVPADTPPRVQRTIEGRLVDAQLRLRARVWIERLPTGHEAALAVLDELCR